MGADNQLAQRQGGGLHRPCKPKARAETALQTDGAFATDRGGFDHFSVGDNDQRYHAAVRKIHSIDRIPGAVTHRARRQRDLSEIGLQQRDRVVRLRCKKMVFRRPVRDPPLIRGAGLLVTGLTQVTAVPQVDELCSRPYDTPHTLRGIGRGVAGGSRIAKGSLGRFLVRPERGKIAPWKIFGKAL